MLRSYLPWCYILRLITVVIRKSCRPRVVHSLSTGFFLFCVRILNLKVQCNKYITIIQCIQRGYRFQTSESDVIDIRFWRLKTTLVSYFSALTLSTLNLPLSSSCTTSRELLSQFSNCSGYIWFEMSEKLKKIAMYLKTSFMEIFILTPIIVGKLSLFSGM